MDKILNRIKKKNWLITGFFIFAIPLIIPIVIIKVNSKYDLNISLNEYNKYFEIYSGYFAGLLTVFISIFAIKYELNQSKIEKNREKRIKLYEKLSQAISKVNKNYMESKSMFIGVYTLKDIDKYIDSLEKIAGAAFEFYKIENDNWKEKLIEDNINKRWESFNEILNFKKEISINLKYILNNSLLFYPIDQVEKAELKYSEVIKDIDILEEYLNNINKFIIYFNNNEYKIQRMFLAYQNKYESELKDYLDETDRLLFGDLELLESLDLLELYLNYSILYLKGDLIYLDNNWKKEFLKDYNEKFYNLVNRNEIKMKKLLEVTSGKDYKVKK